jgi:hypothetical protein
MVSSVIPGLPEDTIQVFIDSKIQPYYTSQLRLSTETETEILTGERFFAYLTALQICQPGMSNLHSLNAARVYPISVQTDRPRMLIADSVGGGKTIEGGILVILQSVTRRRLTFPLPPGPIT